MLSFIIPVYKTPEQLLRNCLDSVLKYSEPMELICVLDSPGDPCEQVLDEYAAKEPRMRLLKNDRNRGVSYSRNRGLDAATGEWVAFVDADDEIIASIYEQMVGKAAMRNLAGIAVNAGKTEMARWGVAYGEVVEGTMRDPSSAVMLAGSYYMAVYPMVLRRVSMVKCTFRFREGHRYGEDFMAIVSFLCTGERFAYWNMIGYKCVGHPGSACRVKPSADNFTHGLIAGLEVFKQITEAKVCSAVIRWYLSRVIPMLFFNPQVRQLVKGEARMAYIENMRQMAIIIKERCGCELGFISKMIFSLLTRHPALWFCPGMPLSLVLRMAFYFGKGAKR